MTTSVESDSFFSKIQKECSIVSNALFILGKMKNDNCFAKLKQSLTIIFGEEFSFVLDQIVKTSTGAQIKDIKSKVATNMYIFKENLKLIASRMGKVISRRYVEAKYAEL